MRGFKTAVVLSIAALLFVSPDGNASPESGRLSIGGMAGWSYPTSSYSFRYRGGDKYEKEFEPSGLLGGNVMYRFPSGLAVDLSAYHQQMKMKEDAGINPGTLKKTPVLLSFKYYELPESDTGFGGHFGAGAGVVYSRFAKKNGLNRTDTDLAPALSFGGGLDYFLTENVSLGFSGRYLLTDIKATGGKFKASNVQALMHLRFWF